VDFLFSSMLNFPLRLFLETTVTP